ncbi:PAS domain S-box protein [Desulfatitalea tepidiphila]|uniref:PAS domain S-box protein n=1 Tax=Desulfatitalea tepidiphila TaxID=1185843 RepID=UPI0006B5A458|nr:PAS domain S-box protein [Desulfatitalea tepidiphila]
MKNGKMDYKPEHNQHHRLNKQSSLKKKKLSLQSNLDLPADYMRLVLENTHEAIMIIQDEKYKFINQNFANVYGYSPEEMYRKSIKDIVHPEDYERVRSNYYRRLKGEQVEKYPYRIIDKSGNIKWMELSGVEILWKGKPAALNFITEITRRVIAEEALKKSERQLSDIVNFMPQALFAIDREGKVIAWNMRMEELSGIKSSDMIGKGNFEYALPFYGQRKPILIDLITRPDISADKDYLSINRGKNFLHAEKFIENNGNPLWLQIETSLIHDHEGNVLGAIESIQNITNLRNAQKELKEQTVHLEEANTALKVLLRHREEDRNEIEQKFVSNIKNLVMPYLEKLKTTGLSTNQTNYLSIAELHLSEVLSPFLIKMERGKTGLTPREIEIVALVKDGKTTKEIAQLLCIGETTVNNHRRRLREKMGLRNKKSNLRSHLLSFEE